MGNPIRNSWRNIYQEECAEKTMDKSVDAFCFWRNPSYGVRRIPTRMLGGIPIRFHGGTLIELLKEPQEVLLGESQLGFLAVGQNEFLEERLQKNP